MVLVLELLILLDYILIETMQMNMLETSHLNKLNYSGFQVAYTIYPVISDRLRLGGYDYARSLGKPIYATFYTDKVPFYISYAPL